jgi:hypothetical protein
MDHRHAELVGGGNVDMVDAGTGLGHDLEPAP